MNNANALQSDFLAVYAQIPQDFPRLGISVSGLQPKFSSVAYAGRYYPPGCTPPVVFERWESFEDMARQLAEKAKISKRAKALHLSNTEVLANYWDQLLGADCGSDDEVRWAIRRAAQLLGCEAPDAAKG